MFTFHFVLINTLSEVIFQLFFRTFTFHFVLINTFRTGSFKATDKEVYIPLCFD